MSRKQVSPDVEQTSLVSMKRPSPSTRPVKAKKTKMGKKYPQFKAEASSSWDTALVNNSERNASDTGKRVKKGKKKQTAVSFVTQDGESSNPWDTALTNNTEEIASDMGKYIKKEKKNRTVSFTTQKRGMNGKQMTNGEKQIVLVSRKRAAEQSTPVSKVKKAKIEKKVSSSLKESSTSEELPLIESSVEIPSGSGDIVKKEKKKRTTVSLATKKSDKPDWKVIKKKSVDLKKKRKEKKHNYDIGVKAKVLWEQLRREDCPVEKKASLVVEIYNLLKEEMPRMVYAHDTSRVVQTLLRLGSPTVRSSIVTSLAPSIVDMLQKKFSSFCVKSMLKYGDSSVHRIIIRTFQGHIVKLMSRVFAARVVAYACENHALREEKRFFRCEFYGDSMKLMTADVMNLEQALANSPDLKASILHDTKTNISKAIDKGLAALPLIQQVISDFLTVASVEDRDEILPLLHPHIVDLLQSKEGSLVAMKCCWFASPKSRKSFLKKIKGRVLELCTTDHGHWMILALLDCVDDTVALQKVVLKELLADVINIVQDEYGRKVVLYSVLHRDTKYFHPSDLALLSTGDNSSTIKKSCDTRRSEILNYLIGPLLASIASNVGSWFITPSVGMVALAVLTVGKGEECKNAMSAVAEYICQDVKIKDNDKDINLIEHAGFHFILKRIIKSDSTREADEETFTYSVSRKITEKTINLWLKSNRGCFTLETFMQSGITSGVELLRQKFPKKIRTMLEDAKTPGAKALLSVLTASK